MAPDRPLKLRAHDADDLRVIAACLQDALVPVGDMAWRKDERRFLLIASRFCWEAEPQAPLPPDPDAVDPEEDTRFAEAGPLYSRVNCGLCIDRVRAVKIRNLDLAHKDQLLNLLTLTAEGPNLTLVFSGGVEIRVETARLALHLEDLGEAWPTRWRPGHTLDEPDRAG